MKIEITEKGCFSETKTGVVELEVGKVVSIKGNDIPASMVNKCRVIASRKAKVTNPAVDAINEDVKPSDPDNQE